jgi:3-oxoacyl-[acyl-carrier-protein] synthase-1
MSALMISAIGMTTSLGIDSIDSCAAARAGLVRLTEIDTLNTANDIRFGREDLDGIPMCVGHAVPVIADGRIGAAKLVALATPALSELIKRARLIPEQLGRTGLCLNVSDAYFQNRWGESPETVNEFDAYPKFWRSAISDLPARLSRSLKVSFSRRLQSTLAGGRVGLIDILDQAANAIDAGIVDRCVVGCIESCLEPEALQAYARAGILKTAANPTGFIPGEGAAFLLVEPAARNVAGGATLGIVGAAASQDVPYGESEAVCGNGIMAAISNALGDRQPGQITERLAETERTCGVWVIDIERPQVLAFLKFEEAVQEIFAVALLPGMRFPDLINDDAELVGSSFVLPDAALRDVPAELRAES